jgi:hypothetical protein
VRRPVLAAALPAALLLACAPLSRLRAQTGLTIYNDGRVLVRRSVPLTVPKGVSEQRLTLGALDPASLFALDSGVTFVAARYDGGVDEASIIRRAVGRLLLFQTGSGPKDTVSATLLGVDPERYRLADGSVVFSRPGTLRYPPDLVLADPTVALAVRSDLPRRALGVGYFTGGAAWQASYQVILGRADARVSGSAVLPSQTLRADSAEIQLLAGAVNRVTPQSPQPYEGRMMAAKDMAADEVSVASEQKVGEFHLYSLPGRWSIRPGVTTSVAMFDPATVPYERSYVVRGEIPFWGYFPQQPNESPVPVEVSYLLKRPRKSDFGDRPIPLGIARIYAADSNGRQQLVGEAAVGHTAAGQDLRLSAGDAFDLTARRVQTNYATRRDSTRSGWRTTATADYAVTIANATDSATTVDVLERRAGDWTVVSSSVPPEKLSSTETRFRVKVPARAETRLTYRVRVTW